MLKKKIIIDMMSCWFQYITQPDVLTFRVYFKA